MKQEDWEKFEAERTGEKPMGKKFDFNGALYWGVGALSLVLAIYLFVLAFAPMRILDAGIDREVIHQSQGYIDGQVTDMMNAYGEYNDLSVNLAELNVSCPSPCVDGQELKTAYRNAQLGLLTQMEIASGKIPQSEVPQEITSLLQEH